MRIDRLPGASALLEVLISTPAFQDAVVGGAPASQLQRIAAAGGCRPLRELAVERVEAGQTTLQELERVLGGAGEDSAEGEVRSPHVLVVDDDGVSRGMARALLSR